MKIEWDYVTLLGLSVQLVIALGDCKSGLSDRARADMERLRDHVEGLMMHG